MGTEIVLSRMGSAIAERELDSERLVRTWTEGRATETLDAYKSDLAHFTGWLADELDITSMAGSDAVRWLLSRHHGEANEAARTYRSHMSDAAGLAPATINRRLASLRSLVSLGKELGYIAWDLSIKNVASQAYRDTAGPTTDVFKQLLGIASKHPDPLKRARDMALLVCLRQLSLRAQELLNCDLASFDNRAAKISVVRKRKREAVKLSLPPSVLKVLRAWVELRGRTPGPLFRSINRGKLQGRLSYDGLHKMFEGWSEQLGVHVRPHGLRHSGITAVLDASKGDLRKARHYSGHAKVDTLIIYDDARGDMGGEMANLIDGEIAAELAKLES